MTWSQSWTVVWSMVLSGITPALATRQSNRSHVRVAASIIASASASTETSPTTMTSRSGPLPRRGDRPAQRIAVDVGRHDPGALLEEDFERRSPDTTRAPVTTVTL